MKWTVFDAKYTMILTAHETGVNFIVDWGDGTLELNSIEHKYKETGTYEVTIISSVENLAKIHYGI